MVALEIVLPKMFLPSYQFPLLTFFLELINDQQLSFKISCSKGTYIRSIARDIGERLGVGGHLIKLRRTKSGSFDLADSISIENCIKIIEC